MYRVYLTWFYHDGMADKIQGLSQFTDEQLQQLARTPVAQPPPGVTPNFDNPPTRAALQIWTTSIFFGVAMILYANRVYVKTRLMKTWSWDDGKFALHSNHPLRPDSRLTFRAVTLFLTVVSPSRSVNDNIKTNIRKDPGNRAVRCHDRRQAIGDCSGHEL